MSNRNILWSLRVRKEFFSSLLGGVSTLNLWRGRRGEFKRTVTFRVVRANQIGHETRSSGNELCVAAGAALYRSHCFLFSKRDRVSSIEEIP